MLNFLKKEMKYQKETNLKNTDQIKLQLKEMRNDISQLVSMMK